MSDASQGPGWWRASDDKWYPPELAPSVAAVPTAPAAPATPPSSKGCLIAALVVFGLIALVGIAAIVAINYFADDVVDEAFGGGPCPFLSDDEAAAALGDGVTAFHTKGLSR